MAKVAGELEFLKPFENALEALVDNQMLIEGIIVEMLILLIMRTSRNNTSISNQI